MHMHHDTSLLFFFKHRSIVSAISEVGNVFSKTSREIESDD